MRLPLDEPYEHLDEDGVLLARKNDVLAEICRAIVRSPEASDVVQEVAVRLQRCFGTASVGVWFREHDRLVLEGLCLPDELEDPWDELLRSGWGVAPIETDLPGAQAMRARAILRWPASDPTLDPGVRRALRGLEVDGILAVPAFVEGEPVGCAVVGYSRERPLTAVDEALIESALGVVAIVYQRARLQEREREHQRRAIETSHLTALGEFSAGLAHELNNPLDAVVHFAELMLCEASGPEEVRRLGGLLHEARRACGVLDNLRLFAQMAPEAKAPRRLVPIIEEVLGITSTRLRVAGVTVELIVEDPDAAAVLSGGQLRRALHQILTNARQAMQEDAEGTLRIELRPSGTAVEIVIDDTGPGLTPEVRGGLFRPFFSHPPQRASAGMGLALAYGIVQEHGGEIMAGNWGHPRALGGAQGEGGARITLRLPATYAPAPTRTGPAEAPAVPTGKTEVPRRIMVVEDEPLVARPLVAYLERRGHQVDHFASAEAAVEHLGSAAPPQVIISDVRMPGMGGIGLFEHLKEGAPHLLGRLLFVSGDVVAPATRSFLEMSERPYLEKPYSFAELEAILTWLDEDRLA